VNLQNLVLITGGAKSGKSEFAENLASAAKRPVVYLATMSTTNLDPEMQEKIKRHQKRRPHTWRTVEAGDSSTGSDLVSAIDELPRQQAVCLVDCLSLYIAGILWPAKVAEKDRDDNMKLEAYALDRAQALLDLMARRSELAFIVVTSEVGSGVVPESAIGRVYRDVLGAVNQEFARQADQVYLSCSGLQIKLKPTPT
jgi:adenosylcobinamide kinase/adenosylcobinamide-phosphate guanylyltransferase